MSVKDRMLHVVETDRAELQYEEACKKVEDLMTIETTDIVYAAGLDREHKRWDFIWALAGWHPFGRRLADLVEKRGQDRE